MAANGNTKVLYNSTIIGARFSTISTQSVSNHDRHSRLSCVLFGYLHGASCWPCCYEYLVVL